jgi:hypothetical protein
MKDEIVQYFGRFGPKKRISPMNDPIDGVVPTKTPPRDEIFS